MPQPNVLIALWRYHCPECGLGDRELGHHAPADTIWCEVCLETRRYVRLERWPVDESAPPAASTTGGRS